jgi:hypothetical protein
MSIYSNYTIITTTGEIIPLKFIESIHYSSDNNDQIVDKLKGDVFFHVRTISGKEYTISVNNVHQQIGGTVAGKDLAAAIYAKWLWIHKP